MNVVISQSMLFPWVGTLEQIKLADVFIHLDDVALSLSARTRRVQIKTEKGFAWMTVPLKNFHRGQKIQEVRIDTEQSWKAKHIALLNESFQGRPYRDEAVSMVKNLYSQSYSNIGDLARESMILLSRYFEISCDTQFFHAAELGCAGTKTERLVNLVKAVGGSTYITGLGALEYLEQDIFHDQGIDVRYMEYRKRPYPQGFGVFNPFISGLDLIANCGRGGAEYICSTAGEGKN